MKSKLILLLLILKISLFFAQKDTIRAKYRDIDDLKTKLKEHKIEQLVYIDSTFRYKLKIPKWLNLQETGDDTSIGGTFPPTKNIVNALMINGFEKNKFKSFEEFKHIFDR